MIKLENTAVMNMDNAIRFRKHNSFVQKGITKKDTQSIWNI